MLFPYFALVDFRRDIEQFFVFLVNPIKSESKAQNPSNNKGVVLLLTLLNDSFEHPGTNFGAISIPNHNFQLQPILLNEDESNQSIKMVFRHVSLQGEHLFTCILLLGVVDVPELRDQLCYLLDLVE